MLCGRASFSSSAISILLVVRIVSLIPSATETLFALGLGPDLIAVTHECDYPPAARELPKVTRDLLPAGLSAREIDTAVKERTLAGESIYELDDELLRDLRPDLIVTQELCSVCAVSYDDVKAVAERIEPEPQVISLDPHTLGEVLGDVRTLADATGSKDAGVDLIQDAASRIDALTAPKRMVVLRNATTDSPWPLSNNPAALFNDRRLGPNQNGSNLDLPLWQIVRASTAAPTYFPPEVVMVGGGSVQRLGVCGGGDMTGRAVSGWGIVDGLGVAAGRNARGRRDAQCRADGARPARQPPRHCRLGADAARGQAAPGVRPASRRRRASRRASSVSPRPPCLAAGAQGHQARPAHLPSGHS